MKLIQEILFELKNEIEAIITYMLNEVFELNLTIKLARFASAVQFVPELNESKAIQTVYIIQY